MNNVLVAGLGVDICSDWEFIDGDLKLVKYEDNLIQSIRNRLNTVYGTCEVLYDEYGSYLYKYLGWRNNEETIDFIKMEIGETLKQDPRLQSFNIVAEHSKINYLKLYITVYFNDDTDLSLSLVITDEMSVEEEESNEQY